MKPSDDYIRGYATALQRCRAITQLWLDCYPEHVFPAVTPHEREQYTSLITRQSAAMGRHMARGMLRQFAELEMEPSIWQD